MENNKSLKKIGIVFIKLLVSAIIVAPFYIALVYSVKSKQEIAFNRLKFPTMIHWDNFSRGIEMSNFWVATKNSVISTIFGVIIITVICSMASYIIARKNTRFYNAMYYMFLGAILIPFQSIMTPLYIDLRKLGLVNSITGFTMTKIGFQIAFTILIVTGFVKTIPKELEESASIDGAGKYRTFWSIVFPLMKPIIFTSVILNSLNFWNDFQIAITILQQSAVRTLPLTQYYFFGENSIELGLAFAVFVLSMIPILILYFSLQKYIISGITSGAIKG